MIKYLVFILLTFATLCSGQRSAASNNADNYFHNPKYTLGYYGNTLTKPGIKAGVDFPFKTFENSLNNNDGVKKKYRQLSINTDFGVFWNPKSFVATFINGGIQFQRTGYSGFQFHGEINPIGIYRSWLPETYLVEAGNVEKVALPGRFYYSPSISFGIGKSRPNKKLKAFYIDLNIMVLMPYNTSILPMISLEYGYRFNFKRNKK